MTAHRLIKHIASSVLFASVALVGCVSKGEQVSGSQDALAPAEELLHSVSACEASYQGITSNGGLATWQILAAAQGRTECVMAANDGAVPALEEQTSAVDLAKRFETFRSTASSACNAAAANLGVGTEAFFGTRTACVDQWEQLLTRSILDSFANRSPLVMPEGNTHSSEPSDAPPGF